MRHALVLVAALAIAAAAQASDIDAERHLQPRSDRYQVEWSGISLGEGTISLEHDGENCYYYVSRTDPIALVRWTYGSPREESRFCVRDGRLIPQHFRYTNDKREEDSFRLDFDWRSGQVKALKGGVMTVRDVPEVAYDRFVIREAVRLWVIRHVEGDGPAEREFVMVDDDRIKAYRFAIGGEETVETPAGTFETVRVDRVGDPKREAHYWLAPSRDYVPVKLEQLRKGKPELRMTLLR
jgi:hypothetical protein